MTFLHSHPRANLRPPLQHGALPTALKPRRALLAAILLGSGSWAIAQPSVTGPKTPEAPVVNSTLNAPLFYQLLLGELNLIANEPGAAYSLILDAARKQRSAQLYRRAVEVSLQARSGDAALTAARAWAQDLPQDKDASRFVLQILLALNRASETAPVLRTLLERSTLTERNDIINALPQTFARVADKAQAGAVVRETLAPYLKQPAHAASAWTSLGRMELSQNQLPAALRAASQAQTADPKSQSPALLALELLERGITDAESILRQYLKVVPIGQNTAPAVALSYSRLLFDLQRNRDARALLEQLTTAQPRLSEAWLLLASVQLQDNTLEPAATSLQTFMGLQRQTTGDGRSSRGLAQAYLLMAQIAEKQRDFVAANAWLDRIENAEDIMAAQMRRASLLARQGQLPQARALLRQLPERRPDDARLKLVAEAQLLRDLKAYDQAFAVYGEAVLRFPEDVDLQYDQAMMAEKANQIADMERLLRQVIAVRPTYHHAYNALGYSLADRNLRLAEAKQLIEKAVELAPNDAYIQDSLGWVEFRLGNTARALELLQSAYAKRPDAEIAAHLGEVLWVSEQRKQALKIWREGLLLSSDNETLIETLRRFQVKP